MDIEIPDREREDLVLFLEKQKEIIEIMYCDIKQIIESMKQAKTISDINKILILLQKKKSETELLQLEIQKVFLGYDRLTHIR